MHGVRVGTCTIAVERGTIGALSMRFISRKTSHIDFLIDLLRLQDVLSVTLHLCCCLEFVLDIDPSVSGVVSILLADGPRMKAIMNHSHNSFSTILGNVCRHEWQQRTQHDLNSDANTHAHVSQTI